MFHRPIVPQIKSTALICVKRAYLQNLPQRDSKGSESNAGTARRYKAAQLIFAPLPRASQHPECHMERDADLSERPGGTRPAVRSLHVEDGIHEQGGNAVSSFIHPEMPPWLSVLHFELYQAYLIYCIKTQYFGKSTMTAALDPEAVHPSLWRASQLARSHTRTIDTGHPALSNQLPGGGWPAGTLVDLLLQQPGIGEVRLLAPALSKVASRQIAFLHPPHAPQALALASMGIPPSSALWLRADRTADALWAAEQVLRSGSCGALLFWQNQIRSDSLRRLNLAAQAGETLFFMMRPMVAAQDASPAPLRLGLRPRAGGIEIDFVKRKGPQRDEPLFLPMSITTTRAQPHREAIPVPVAAMPTPTPAHVVHGWIGGEKLRYSNESTQMKSRA